MDMHFYWVQDRHSQGHFNVYWHPGSTNLADYFTKHHPPSHHRRLRSTYLHCLVNYLSSVMQGCVDPVPEFPAQTAVTRIRPMHNRTQSHPEVRTHKPASSAELVVLSRESKQSYIRLPIRLYQWPSIFKPRPATFKPRIAP
eukprot:scaffold103920_cov55-Attheya_sp.AAC.1